MPTTPTPTATAATTPVETRIFVPTLRSASHAETRLRRTPTSLDMILLLPGIGRGWQGSDRDGAVDVEGKQQAAFELEGAMNQLSAGAGERLRRGLEQLVVDVDDV